MATQSLNLIKVSIQDLARGRQPFPKGWSYNKSTDGIPKIIAHGKQWPLVAIPNRSGGKAIVVIGADRKQYRHLLMSPDTLIVGTRGEIQAEFNIRTFYPSQHLTTKQRRVQARERIFKQLGINADPERDDIEFVPPNRRYRQQWHTFMEERDKEGHADVMVVQPKGMRRKTWLNLLNRLRTLNGSEPYSYPPLGRKRRWRHRFQRV
jgi:hypothetical protein